MNINAIVATTNKLESGNQPFSLEAEERILCFVLLGEDSIDFVIDNLEPRHFYYSPHRLIYQAAVEVFNKVEPVNLLSIYNWLEANNELERVGGRTKLVALLDSTFFWGVSVETAVNIIKEKYIRRQLLFSAEKIHGLGTAEDIGLESILDLAEQELFRVTQSIDGSNNLRDAQELALDTYALIESKFNREKLSGGFKSGFTALDEILEGMYPGDLVIVAGRPASGKTALAVNIGVNIAEDADMPVLMFSLEMGAEQIMQRIFSTKAKIPSNRLSKGDLTEEELVELMESLEIMDLPIFIDDTPNPSVNQMRSIARKLCLTHKGLGLIIVDYLQLIEGNSDNRNLEISKITRSLKQLARELHCPVMVLSQLSRNVENRADKRPVMSDLRDSGAIEQDADAIVFLYRDEYYNKESEEKGIAEVIVAKHRNGGTGTAKLKFESSLTRFGGF